MGAQQGVVLSCAVETRVVPRDFEQGRVDALPAAIPDVPRGARTAPVSAAAPASAAAPGAPVLPQRLPRHRFKLVRY